MITGLIFDRTADDLVRVSELDTKMRDGTATAAEAAAWLAGLKGAYGAADLNRVGAAISDLQTALNAVQGILDARRAAKGVAPGSFWTVPWPALSLTPKTDWAREDKPTAAQLAAYLQNVVTVTGCIIVHRSLPQSMAALTIAGANGIEQAIADEDSARESYQAGKLDQIDKTAAAFVCCGEFYGGEV